MVNDVEPPAFQFYQADVRNPKVKKVSLGENKQSQQDIDLRSLPKPKSDEEKKSELQLARNRVKPLRPMSN